MLTTFGKKAKISLIWIKPETGAAPLYKQRGERNEETLQSILSISGREGTVEAFQRKERGDLGNYQCVFSSTEEKSTGLADG